jgi:hypothetical protein
MLIVPVTVSHLLFAAILWGLCRIAFGKAVEENYRQLPQRTGPI